MINFRCPKCGNWLSVPMSQAGRSETCPICGNVVIVPALSQSTTPPSPSAMGPGASRQGGKPAMPPVILWGLGLYIFTCFLGLVHGALVGLPGDMSEEQARTLVGLACIALFLFPAEVLGVVLACLGHAWGAILLICITALSLLVRLAGAAAAPFLFMRPLGVISSVTGIASLICFVVPSAWRYYDASAAYRRSVRRN